MKLVRQFTGNYLEKKDKDGKVVKDDKGNPIKYESSFYFLELDNGICIYVDIADYKDSRTLAKHFAEVRHVKKNEH